MRRGVAGLDALGADSRWTRGASLEGRLRDLGVVV